MSRPMHTSPSASSIDQLQTRSSSSSKPPSKRRRRSDKLRLPTPPPDPNAAPCPPTPDVDHRTQTDKEAEFLEYLESLQKSPLILGAKSAAAAFAPAEATEHAINHLDKLYKLMSQMLALREQNILLHRRIVDLERFRSMQCMDKKLEMCAQLERVPDDYDTNAENVLYSILAESKKEAKKVQQRLQKPFRKSFKVRHFEADDDTFTRRISMPTSGFSGGGEKQKVSKWTKVKAAFKWEKASPTVSDAKSQDSGLGGLGLGAQPVNYEVARYLRVPSTNEEAGVSPADSGAAEVSTPATLSSASSAEELHRHQHARRRTHEDTSDDDQLFMYSYIPIDAKDEASTSKSKHHRTPWAKVKDIIQTQTRNSFKIRHRLSAKSDDFKSVDESMAVDSENEEEVFDGDATEPKSPILIIQSPEEISRENEAFSLEHSIPVDVIARYRITTDEVGIESRWEKVKKAFLVSPSTSKNDSSSPTTPEPYTKTDAQNGDKPESRIQEEIQRNYLQLQKKLSLEFQEKLQEWERNKLHAASTSALSSTPHGDAKEDSKEIAFKKKMEEWQKIKGQPKHNMQLKSEENLPPEFRKKLEEWKKIKKSSVKEDKKKPSELPKWKSFGGPKTDLENQQLSDDFIKKYETWKQIKAGVLNPEDIDRVMLKGNKSPSPKLLRKDGSKRFKDSEKELQWFDKGIEKEKHRLERDKQKFFEREQRMSKLQRSITGTNKKEILVHLPSGFYRFEGISRKFTQKLYEWEKARGIRPEESTFALLRSPYIPHIEPKSEHKPGTLTRSKSADSVMNVEPVCSLLSQRPSSLSLNELENLEEEMLLGENVPDIIRSSKNISHEEEETEEPEAVIVEVEDVVEETASHINVYDLHFPVYQKQETGRLCAGETSLGPTIRRSESARAQVNYNLIEEIIDVIKRLLSNENEIDDIEGSKSQLVEDSAISRLKHKQEQQKCNSETLIEKLIQLQEANSNVAMNLAREEPKYKMAKLLDVLDSIHDLTTELFGLAESIDHFIYKRNKTQLEYDGIVASKQSYPQIGENLITMKVKIFELRRNLSYVCTASDIAVASFKRKEDNPERPLLRKTSSVERKRSAFRQTRSRDSREEYKEEITSSPTLSRQIEQGAVKKRMRYRKGLQSKALDESDDDDNEVLLQEQRKAKPRRLRSQNSTESNKSISKTEDTKKGGKDDECNIQNQTDSKDTSIEIPEVIVDPAVIEKILIPTKTTNFTSSFEELTTTTSLPNETADVEEDEVHTVTVFVRTTRKLFTPIGTTTDTTTKSTDDDRGSATPSTSSITSTSSNNNPQLPLLPDSTSSDNIMHLPPIPASPTPQRKIPKEISPNIRLMMVRYNQKITEETSVRSPCSSGSASPVAWRSPVLERRVKAQTEKYQQDLQKMSPLLGGRREVQKSASMGVVVSGNKQVTVHKPTEHATPKGILKSSSASVLKSNFSGSTTTSTAFIRKPSSPIMEHENGESLNRLIDARSIKLQKAKEEFLRGFCPSNDTLTKNHSTSLDSKLIGVEPTEVVPDVQKQLRYPLKNRLSQVSVGSDFSSASSSYGLLMKSASAGMINIDARSYQQLHPEMHTDGSASLPRAGKKNLLSNIKQKFRNVRMRRNKDKDKDKDRDKMNAVSTLCRQSLMVDVRNSSQETLSEDQCKLSLPSDSRGSSTDTSPSTSRTSSWIKKPKLFTTKK